MQIIHIRMISYSRIDAHIKKHYEQAKELFNESFSDPMKSYGNLANVGLQILNRSDFKKGWLSGAFANSLDADNIIFLNPTQDEKEYYIRKRNECLKNIFKYIGDSNSP